MRKCKISGHIELNLIGICFRVTEHTTYEKMGTFLKNELETIVILLMLECSGSLHKFIIYQ